MNVVELPPVRARTQFAAVRAAFISLRGIIVTAAGTWLILLALVLGFHDNVPINAVEAVAERIQIRTFNPALAAFPVDGLELVGDDPFAKPAAPECPQGMFTPAQGSIVEYARTSNGALRISVRPQAGEVEAGEWSGNRPVVEGTMHFIASLHCGVLPPTLRLPVWGATALGDDVRGLSDSGPASGLLLEGQISVSARSVTFFGLLQSTLYHVATVPLPAGSRVSEVGPDDLPDGALWAGFVAVEAAEPAMTFRAVTDARNLKLYLPGQRKDAEQLRVGLLVPVFQDPYLLLAQIVLGSLLLVLQALITVMEFFFRHRPPEPHVVAALDAPASKGDVG